MSRGINRVVISGKVVGRINFNETGNNSSAGSFYVLSERHTHDAIVAVRAKINAYGEGLVGLLRVKLVPGVYVLVDGELMTRKGQHEESVEVRATQIVFPVEDSNATGAR
jgi:single-stranded DNA-binding protein